MALHDVIYSLSNVLYNLTCHIWPCTLSHVALHDVICSLICYHVYPYTLSYIALHIVIYILTQYHIWSYMMSFITLHNVMHCLRWSHITPPIFFRAFPSPWLIALLFYWSSLVSFSSLLRLQHSVSTAHGACWSPVDSLGRRESVDEGVSFHMWTTEES